ncbi:tetratricopeptide repeat protein [Neomoorella mulderi]|uniref:Uncharacterized protein n=1 Tax=Moorella mulderi DSM 14980 TaxID=1122241 RepID=A0A151AYV3_9FIRM|nr:hypothetical protein [Moorella mulderi]KYH32818.1 hypothetical protein MOMUL_14200 [Moorella mulderi DSM 14980]
MAKKLYEDMLSKLITEKSRERLLEFLAALPPETDRNFELYLTKMAQKIPDINGLLTEVLEKPPVTGEEKADLIAFACFFALNIYYRHRRDITKVHDIIEKYRHRFSHHPMFPHVLSLYYRSTGSIKDLKTALDYAQQAAQLMPGNPGVQHSLAEALINLMDEGEIEKSEANLNRAEEAINKAIMLEATYPKFYSTRGRLLALKGMFKEAREAVEQAIDMEDSTAHDYPIRYSGYQDILGKIRQMEFSRQVDKKLAEAEGKINKARQETEEQLKQFRVQNLEFLGLFAAIISFTVGSIQFVSRLTFEQGVILLLIFTGSLLYIYSGLSIVLHGRAYLSRTIIVLALALILFFVSLAFKGVLVK